MTTREKMIEFVLSRLLGPTAGFVVLYLAIRALS